MALLIGVFIIFISDFVIRSLRAYFLDVAGAQADMVIADTLFEQVIDMELRSRKGRLVRLPTPCASLRPCASS